MNAKAIVRLWKYHTPRDVKHYSRGIKRYRKWLRHKPQNLWQQELERIGNRMMRMPFYRLLGINEEDVEQWKRDMMGKLYRAQIILRDAVLQSFEKQKIDYLARKHNIRN